MNKLKILKEDTQENSKDETFCPTVNLLSEKKNQCHGSAAEQETSLDSKRLKKQN